MNQAGDVVGGGAADGAADGVVDVEAVELHLLLAAGELTSLDGHNETGVSV